MAPATAAFDAMPAEWKAIYFGAMFVVILLIVALLVVHDRRSKVTQENDD